jgi:hypothetical protein
MKEALLLSSHLAQTTIRKARFCASGCEKEKYPL